MILAATSAGGAGLMALAIGMLMTWTGLQTWRGKEAPSVRRAQEGGYANPLGGRLQYGTLLGTSGTFLLTGPGFLLIGLALLARAALGQPEDWWVFTSLRFVGIGLILLGVVYLVVYQWFGVPDALRPPAQRGQPWPGRRRGRRHGRGDPP